MHRLRRGKKVGVLMYCVKDVMMPIMDGLTSTMLIRKYEWERGLKRTPIIMQTGTPLSHTSSPSISLSLPLSLLFLFLSLYLFLPLTRIQLMHERPTGKCAWRRDAMTS